MKRTIMVFGMAAALLALGACSSMSPEECVATDWTAVGYEDGARGLTSEYFGNHRKACAKHGVTADFRAYQVGREEGLLKYCQPGRGYDVGVSGGRYSGVCDPALEEEFLDAYNAGFELYTLRSNVSRVSAQIAARENEQVNIANTIRNKEALLIAEETTVQDRILILADLKQLSERTGEIETEIAVLIEERAHHQLELDNYRNTVAAFGY